jgi:tetratricopeptide (TPR) repeat protein
MNRSGEPFCRRHSYQEDAGVAVGAGSLVHGGRGRGVRPAGAGPAGASPDTPEALGRSLLRIVSGDPAPLADFLTSPADPARQAGLEDWLYDALDEQPGLRDAMAVALTGYCRRRAASGDAQALADLGDLLRWQQDFDAARDAYQQAVDLGHDRALPSLASLLRTCLGDVDCARAWLRRAIGCGDPDVAAEGMVDLGHLLCSAGDMAGGRAAFQDAIATGHPKWAPEAMMGLGHWLSMRGDRDGALAAYQQAIGSGRADLAGHAWFSVGKLLYRQGDLSRAKSVLKQLIDSHASQQGQPEENDLDRAPAPPAGAGQ